MYPIAVLGLLASGQRAAEQTKLISFTTSLWSTLERSQHPMTWCQLQSQFWDAWCISYWFPWGTSQACCHYPLTPAQLNLIEISVLFHMQAVEDTGNQMAITKFSLQKMMLSLLTHVELHPGFLGFITNPGSHLLMKFWRFYPSLEYFFLCF